jgi:spore coat-associated protein N
MSRFKVLRANPRRALAAMATLLIAVGVTAASGATFTAQTANPSNQFTAGTLTMTNSKNAAAILTASNMKPGDTATGTVDIKNTGSVSGAFTLGKTALTNSDTGTPMAPKLNVVVTDCGTDVNCALGTSTNVYTGTLAAMGTGIALGNFAGGAEHRYQFDVTLDTSTDNTYQGDNSVATFTWDAS